MRLVFEDQGWEDYTSWLKTDRKMLARINKLIEDVRGDPFTGIGKPEPLKYGFQTDLVQETFLAMAPAASAES